MRTMAIVAWFMISVNAYASNYADCILDKMPGSENDAFTASVISTCSQENPGSFYSIEKGEGRGVFGFSDGNACIQKKSKDTRNQRAAFVIAGSCRCLYDKGSYEGEMCATRPVPIYYSPPPPPAPVQKSEPAPQIQPIVTAPPPAPRLPDAEYLKYDASQRAKANLLAKDMKEASDRAFRNYPYLATPAGSVALAKIVEIRDKLIAEGVYPSTALNRAVFDIAEAYMPRSQPPPEPERKPATPAPAPSKSGCGWVTPQQWLCN